MNVLSEGVRTYTASEGSGGREAHGTPTCLPVCFRRHLDLALRFARRHDRPWAVFDDVDRRAGSVFLVLTEDRRTLFTTGRHNKARKPRRDAGLKASRSNAHIEDQRAWHVLGKHRSYSVRPEI